MTNRQTVSKTSNDCSSSVRNNLITQTVAIWRVYNDISLDHQILTAETAAPRRPSPAPLSPSSAQSPLPAATPTHDHAVPERLPAVTHAASVTLRHSSEYHNIQNTAPSLNEEFLQASHSTNTISTLTLHEVTNFSLSCYTTAVQVVSKQSPFIV